MTVLRLDQWLHQAARRLAAVGIDTARLDARLLAAHVLGLPVSGLILKGDLVPTPQQAEALEVSLCRREVREPVSHILGQRGFWTLDLAVSSAVLDPRPDTETLIEAILDLLPVRDQYLDILDLGTGSGCILLALLSEYPNSRGLGIDASDEALTIARANAVRLGLDGRGQFLLGNWTDGVDGGFGLIVSNPPYIPDADIDRLEPEVRCFEPRQALAGGPDGMDCYRDLAPRIAARLMPGGLAALEVGVGQAGAVSALLSAVGLEALPPRRDLGGIERVVLAKKSVGKRAASD